MRFSLDMSATTKSTTDSGDDDDYGSSDAKEDTEEGSDSENAVESVLVVLYLSEEENQYAMAYSSEANTAGSTVTAVFDGDDLVNMKGKSVNVYLICNVSEEYEFKSLDDVYTLASDTDDTPWKENEFLMTNAQSKTATLPGDLTGYNSEAAAFDLGTVYVERCCARFDYADGSGGNNTYAVETYNETNGVFLPIVSCSTTEWTYEKMKTPNYTVNITLTDLALCNLSKEFYMVRRVVAGKDTDSDNVNDTYDSDVSADYCGTETSSNFVVDTDWGDKSSYDGTSYDTDNFYYTLDSFEGLGFTNIGEILGGTDDKWTNNNNSFAYKVWRYATENTIPSVDKQKAGLSTGVVFKGKIELDENSTSPFAYAFSDGTTSDLFSINNCLFGTWNDVALYAKVVSDNGTTPQFPALYVAYTKAEDELNGASDAKSIREAAIAKGFTVYTYDSDEKCYPVYFYYYNRHNDNRNVSAMGPMEFAVVRNNVYKLAVTEISGYGYGVDADGDPEVPEPNDPDETDDVYFKVSLEILPWVVRVNDITL